MSTIPFNTQFPGYEILGELGRSNARVLKARQQTTGELVAIKHFALNTDDDTIRRFQREAQIMTQIRHPNVVRVREVCLEAALPFIVMELVEGGDLRGLLAERGHLDVSTTIRLGLQMAEAFKAIHPNGIVHRDIKPGNILYRLLPSGELHFLLTDFGIASARIASEQNDEYRTKTGQSLLTYEYASPEQFDNPRQVGIASDYYSLGVVLYESLSGSVPFALGANVGMATFMNQVISVVPPALVFAPPRHLPPSLNQLLTATLVKNPAQRLSDADEVELLLGQARVELLQAKKGIITPVEPKSPEAKALANKTLTAPVEPEPVRSGNQNSPEEPGLPPIDSVPVRPVAPDSNISTSKSTPESTESKVNVPLLLTGLVALLLLISLVIVSNKKPSVPESTTSLTDSTATMATDTVSAMMDDSTATMAIDSASTMAADSASAEPATSGKVIFWSKYSASDCKVYLDGEYEGIMKYFATGDVAPDCDDPKWVTAKLGPGKHKYKVVSEPDKDGQVWTWEDSVNVIGGQCVPVELGK